MNVILHVLLCLYNFTVTSVAAAIKELQSGVVQFMASFVRHFTMALVAQQAGPFMLGDKCTKLQGTDAYVLIGTYYMHYGSLIADLFMASY